MSVWAWIGEGSVLVSLLSCLVCWAVVARAYRTEWSNPRRRADLLRVAWPLTLVVTALLAVNVTIQVLRGG